MYLTCPGGFRGCQILPVLRRRVGPLPKNLRPEASEAWRLAQARVSRVLEALGASFVCVLHVLEASGASFARTLRVGEAPGGSRLKPS